MRERFLLSLFVAATLCASGYGAEDLDLKVSPEARSAIDKALAYLARTQKDDGSWETSGRGQATACMSLAALAFMSDGHLPGRGPYGEVVQKALDFVLESAQPSGLLEYGTPHHAMYSHGFSVLLLAEAWGTTADERIRQRLKKGVEFIVATQNPQGGWRYQPSLADADISVTITQVVALRAAANAGITVPRKTIDAAVWYLKKCARADGGFSYQPGSGSSGFARTGGALLSLILAGRQDMPQARRALKYLDIQKGKEIQYFYYGHYYSAQAVHLTSERKWAQWYPYVSEKLIRRQREDGTWSPGEKEERIHATAMAVLVLTIPNGYLPIYQR